MKLTNSNNTFLDNPRTKEYSLTIMELNHCNNTFLNNPWIKEKIKKEIGKYF